jgi:hypothetical protein
MFVIIYKDGHQEHTYNESDISLLDWDDVVIVIHMNNIEK